MTPERYLYFKEQGFNRIPMTKEVLADTETPVSSYLKLARGPYSYLFESVQGGEKWGRYSFIGFPAKERLVVRGHEVCIFRDDVLLSSEECADPLAFIEQYQKKFRVPEVDGLPIFSGGLAGYFSYDTVRFVEPSLQKTTPKDVIGTPDILLTVSDELMIFDNLQGKITLVVHANTEADDGYEYALRRLDELVADLNKALPDIAPLNPKESKAKQGVETEFVSSFGHQPFLSSVDKIKDYIIAGDTMQVVLSQRMNHAFEAEPINLYRALRCLNPSPYMYFLDMGDHQVVGSSPEILARIEGDQVTVRPIAGTRRRGYNEQEDLDLEQDLVNDPKEIAEHLMLIDLGRNDVGRVAKVGTVELTEKMVVERFSHVMHITSNVVGELKDGLGAMDVLRASLPAGTLSGAPKIRAMEIIDELEPEKRGVYGGAVGYLSWNGNMDTAIAIRTAVIKDNKIYVQAGAGVVADSIPELEWKETMNKARALFSAVEWVV